MAGGRDEGYRLTLSRIIASVHRGTFNSMGDKEHAEIVQFYIEEGLSLNRISEQIGRSSRTPYNHSSAQRWCGGSGFCPSCRREKSSFDCAG